MSNFCVSLPHLLCSLSSLVGFQLTSCVEIKREHQRLKKEA